MTSNRKDERQLSKSQLLQATRVLYLEQNILLAALARRWKRRLAAATAAAFALGAIAGSLASTLGLTRPLLVVVGLAP